MLAIVEAGEGQGDEASRCNGSDGQGKGQTLYEEFHSVLCLVVEVG